MSLSFPSNPSIGQTYLSGPREWTWSGTVWELSSDTVSAGTITDSELATGSVTESKIAVNAVTQEKLASDLSAVTICTSSARPAGFEGQMIYETDTNQALVFTGSTWDMFAQVRGAVLTSPVFVASEERWNIVTSAATGTINVNVLTASAWYYTTASSANWTLNFRGSDTATMNSILSVGDSITVAFASLNGATPYRPTAFQIDASAVTPIWQGGTAPTSGNASATDVYSFTIVKTAVTPTYVVFASQTQYK